MGERIKEKNEDKKIKRGKEPKVKKSLNQETNTSHNMRYEFYNTEKEKLSKETLDGLDFFPLDGEPYSSLD